MVAKVFAGKASRAERIHSRRNIDLEDASLSDKTRVRYYGALRKLLPTVERCSDQSALDNDVSNWVLSMWKQGEPLLTIGDALCALHFFQPTTRRMLPHSWMLFKVWRKLEVPCRAPPLTWALVASMTAFCVDHLNLEMAAIICLAFHCLLRTGEALSVSFDDLMLGDSSGICRLQNTKSGKRNAANEVISIQDPVVLEVLRALSQWRTANGVPNMAIWSRPPSRFRQEFKRLLQAFSLEEHGFRPYSLRRGGWRSYRSLSACKFHGGSAPSREMGELSCSSHIYS